MSFLDEASGLAAIRDIFRSASEAKIAVAFWGTGAVQALGLDRSGLSVEIICNLDSGACNPAEIRRLRALKPSVAVKSDPRLHGKVYWTPSAVVVGSSNASTNGLAVEEGSLKGWAEANLLSKDPQVIEAIRSWFDTRQQAAYEISEEHLKLAERVWNGRKHSAPAGMKLTGDLVEAIRNSNEHAAWQKIKLAVWSENLSPEGRRQLEEVIAGNPALRGHEAYEGWHDQFDGGDWLLDFKVTNGRGKFTGYWAIPDPKLETELLALVRKESAVLLPGLSAMTLNAADMQGLEKLAVSLVQKEPTGRAIIPLAEAVALLDQLKVSGSAKPDLKAFDRAMRSIYTEAARIGYRPTEFMKMIEQDGAFPTAKHLIASAQPSSGFRRLWELKRLDLTVEALVLREPWRQLFSPAELERAQRRLNQYRIAG